jgi:hypothetical protein
MSRVERAMHAWAGQFAGLSQPEIDDRVRGFATIVRVIARSGAISPERFAEVMGIDVSMAEELVADLGAIGMQSDDEGNIIGAALTTQASPHKVHVGGGLCEPAVHVVPSSRNARATYSVAEPTPHQAGTP